MVKIQKKKKLAPKVSKTKLMNLNQLLPSDKKYPSAVGARNSSFAKTNPHIEHVRRNEKTQLLNLCCKYSEEQNKLFRWAAEAADTLGSTTHTKGEPTKPSYYLHKVFIGLMDPGNKETEYSPFKDHFENTRNVFGIINDMKDKKPKAAVNAAEMRAKHEKKLLVLDLDETLISSNECPPHNWDNTDVVNFQLANKFNYTIYVKFRPFVFDFLEAMSRHYEIAIFTASEKAYADAIINKLDPERRLISKRLYNSDCDQVNGIFVKDLSKLGRNLKDVILVDNTVLCFAFQLNNGVPILSYFGSGKGSDTELIDLKEFLISVKDCADVRVPIADYFKWDKVCESYKDKEKVVESIFYD